MAATDMNNKGRRWLTVSQDEYRNPAETKVDRYIQSEEMARYEACMKDSTKQDEEEQARALARKEICCKIQNEMREPTYIPDDHHINPAVKNIPKWNRCLATKVQGCTPEDQAEKEVVEEEPHPCDLYYGEKDTIKDIKRKQMYSSAYFLDYRDPCFPYIGTKLANQQEIADRAKEYKEKKDAEDACKDPRIGPIPHDLDYQFDTRYDKCCWCTVSDKCHKGMINKVVWNTTYRQMNKDGAALPLMAKDIPCSSKEHNANPIRNTIPKGEQKFERWEWDKSIRMAQRCDTMYNRPDLDKDAYFQEHRLCRGKFARPPPRVHITPTKENMDLVKKEKLRFIYDRPIPGYAGYDCITAPPVCKIKKQMNRYDPYEILSNYQGDFIFHPAEIYCNPVQPLRPDDFEKLGISTNPLNTLGRIPLPQAQRLSCVKCDECVAQPDQDYTTDIKICCG